MKRYLNETEEKDVEKIVEASNEHDGTKYSVPDDADLWFLSRHYGRVASFLAVYFMGDTHDGHPVNEVLLFTEPDERGKGRAGRLLKKYSEYTGSFDGEEPHTRFTAYESPAALAFFDAAGSSHEGDELLMTRDLSGDKMLTEDDLLFSNEHSECSVKTYGNTAYIYGVRTDVSHLREGSAEKLLSSTLKKLEEMGAGRALLQVSSCNVPAVRLYEKLMFKVEERMELWYNIKLGNF